MKVWGAKMCDSSGIGLVTWVLLAVSWSVALVSLVLGVSASTKRRALRTAYFQSRYGSSVERMLAECPADQERLRLLRDGDRSGPVKATRELLRSEPVPLQPAAEFIKRL